MLFYYTAVIQTNVNKLSANPDVTVEVVAFKWNWQFNYQTAPDAGRRTTVATTTGTSDYIPVLVVPTGKTIRFEEHSKDVIHSFWVPELLFKRDVFPGNVRNVVRGHHRPGGRLRGPLRRAVRHVPLDDELRAPRGLAGEYESSSPPRSGQTTPQALGAIGFTGKDTYATTTQPFSANAPAGHRRDRQLRERR